MFQNVPVTWQHSQRCHEWISLAATWRDDIAFGLHNTYESQILLWWREGVQLQAAPLPHHSTCASLSSIAIVPAGIDSGHKRRRRWLRNVKQAITRLGLRRVRTHFVWPPENSAYCPSQSDVLPMLGSNWVRTAFSWLRCDSGVMSGTPN